MSRVFTLIGLSCVLLAMSAPPAVPLIASDDYTVHLPISVTFNGVSPKGHDGKYHDVRVEVKNPDYRVRARSGYAAVKSKR